MTTDRLDAGWVRGSVPCMATPVPENIQCIGDLVAVRWNDGSEDYFPMESLRALSPSAEQQGERDLMGNLYGGTDQKKFPGVQVTAWAPIGGYAIQFQFSDGHQTGIYSFEYLKRIAAALNREDS